MKVVMCDKKNSGRGGIAMTIEEVLAFEEMQIFERKSVHIEPKAL